jgi:hypothetical protein
MVLQTRVGSQRLCDRGRICEARGLHHHALERRQLAPLTPFPQIEQRVAQLGPDGAAHTA